MKNKKKLKQNMWATACNHGILFVNIEQDLLLNCVFCCSDEQEIIKVVVTEKNWRKK